MSKFKKIFRIAAPLALGFIPGLQPLAAAALGAGLGALGGGGLKGAILGGLGGGLGAGGLGGAGVRLGSGISNTLGLGGAGAQSISRGVSGALLGASGGGGLRGAIMGGLGGAITPNIGDIREFATGKANELGNFVDRTAGTNMFGPSSEDLLKAPATAYAPNVSSDLQRQVEDNINIWNTQGSPSSGGGSSSGDAQPQSGTSTDMKNIGFKDVIGVGNDLYMNKEAKDAQLAALRRSEAAYAPYMAAGGQGLAELMRGYNPGDLTRDPSYQVRLREGQKALEGSLAARGMSDSGAAMKAITDYGQNMAATAYDDSYRNWYQRNAALAGYGQEGMGQLAGAGGVYDRFGDVRANYSQQLRDLINKGLGGYY